jgi:hypothetical protein
MRGARHFLRAASLRSPGRLGQPTICGGAGSKIVNPA